MRERVQVIVCPSCDATEAQRISDVIVGVPEGSSVVVDFRNVTEFDDRAMALIGQALATYRGQVLVPGLDRHRVRVLRYLGVALPAVRREDEDH